MTRADRMRERNFKHGFAHHPLYYTWHAIKRRCFDPKDKTYPHYGGRGITICDLWRDSCEAFVTYIETTLGPRPARCTIHRIRNHGNYEPGNVEWATWDKQNAPGNKRKRSIYKPGLRMFNVAGETLAQACRRAGVSKSYNGVKQRMKRLGETPQQAIAHFEQRRLLGSQAPSPVKVMVEGLTLMEAYRRVGVVYSSVYHRFKYMDETPTQAIAHFKEVSQ